MLPQKILTLQNFEIYSGAFYSLPKQNELSFWLMAEMFGVGGGSGVFGRKASPLPPP